MLKIQELTEGGGQIDCVRCRLLGLNSWNHTCKCVYQGSNVQLHSAALSVVPCLKGSKGLIKMGNKWRGLIILHNELLSFLGHMWLSKKADGGTILGRGEISKLALCWLGRQPGRDIYTERRVNVRRHMSRHLRRREQPVRDTHLGHPVMSPNKPNHCYHLKPTNYTAFTKDIRHNRGKQILAQVFEHITTFQNILPHSWNFPFLDALNPFPGHIKCRRAAVVILKWPYYYITSISAQLWVICLQGCNQTSLKSIFTSETFL